MSDWVVIMMLGASILLGVFSLIAFLWGLKHNQFDDHERNMNSVLFDSTEDLNDAVKREAKRKSYETKSKG
ncbi:MAG: cytochrome oxidase maturation protein Cbb3 [Sulfurovum sp. PC08-66]|nr:MAG: cytochrome oxidase maturation protein Cbb3 [Sulfurovum sp. PC08-66]KIM12427.1 MAG: cytochrome oxidase maturation protein Cbb3 [Sulfuricurvum sp. PC08-66]